MTVDPNLLPNFQDTKLVRCAACLWWGPGSQAGQGYLCSFDGETVTRATARSRTHPCPWFISRDQYLDRLRDRVWAETSKPIE